MMTFPILVLVTEYQLDLCCVAVNVQLYAGNEARIIGCQKERSSRNLARGLPIRPIGIIGAKPYFIA